MGDDAATVEQLRAELVAARQRETALVAENVRLAAERAEALEQQTATAEVLRAIASAPTSLDTVLDMLVASAARLTRADEAALLKIEGSTLPVIASTGGIRWPGE